MNCRWDIYSNYSSYAVFISTIHSTLWCEASKWVKLEVSPNTYLKRTAARADKTSSLLTVPNSHCIHLTCLFLVLTCLFFLSASACTEEFDIWSFMSCVFNERRSTWALDLRWQTVSGCYRAVYMKQDFLRGSEGREIFCENIRFWRLWKDTVESFSTDHCFTNTRINDNGIF